MSHYYEDMNDDDQDTNNRMQELTLNKKNMPVKAHMRKIEETINELRNDLNNNMKNSQLLRAENAALQSRVQEKCNEVTKTIMDDLYNFEKDLARIKQSDKTETAFFDQQIKSLQQDAVKLKSQVIQLESRLKICEGDVGMDFK